MPISAPAVMTKRPHGRRWYCRRTRILFPHCASPPPAMHSRAARPKRAKCVRDCDKSILHCTFLISGTGWDRTADQKISLGSSMACEKPEYRSDQHDCPAPGERMSVPPFRLRIISGLSPMSASRPHYRRTDITPKRFGATTGSRLTNPNSSLNDPRNRLPRG